MSPRIKAALCQGTLTLTPPVAPTPDSRDPRPGTGFVSPRNLCVHILAFPFYTQERRTLAVSHYQRLFDCWFSIIKDHTGDPDEPASMNMTLSARGLWDTVQLVASHHVTLSSSR